MKQVVKDTIEIYFIDEDTFQLYRKSNRTKKLLKVNWKADKDGMSAAMALFMDENTGRIRTRSITFENIIGNYVFEINEKYIFEYIDNNPFNISKNNIKIKFISDICKEWKAIEGTNRFFVSKNGYLYDDEKHRLVKPYKNIVGYYNYSFNKMHIKRSHLVWKYFSNNNLIPEGYVIDHINNIPSDDRIENLQCITIRENIIKEHKRDLPVGVIKDGNRYASYISYTLNSIKYERCYLGSFSNAKEAGECYQRALALVNKGINPIKRGNNEKIKYKFSNDTWYFITDRIGKPSKKYSGFKTYEDALIAYNNFLETDVSKETEEEKILRRGYFTFHVLDKTFSITRYKYSVSEYISAYKFYKECRKKNCINDLIDALPFIREKIKKESDNIKENLKNKEKEQKLEAKRRYQERRNIEKQEKQKTIEEARLNFVCKSNYTTDKKGYYIMKIPYRDGKWYYLHSFLCLDIVKEIDNIMNEYKYSDDFIEKFKDFKENELPKYVERDTAYKAEKENTLKGKRGYKWFNARNCWRVVKRINNKEYSLGYFKDERCCKMILDEAVNAIKLGVFNEWYNNIEDHRFRIKKLFNDESLPENKTYEANSTVFQKGLCVCQYKNDKLIGNYKTISEASRQFNSNSASKSIGECCRGIKKSYMGYEWKLESIL